MPITLDTGEQFGGSYARAYGLEDEALNKGSLVLIDVNHPLGGFGPTIGTVPVNGAGLRVQNMAWKRLASQPDIGLALTDETSDLLACRVANNFAAGEAGWRRTGKLGVHGAIAQSGLTAGHTCYIEMPVFLKGYIRARALHRYYMAIEYMPTRAALSATDGRQCPLAGIFDTSTAPPNSYFNFFTIGPNGANLGDELVLSSPARSNLVGVPALRTSGSWRAKGVAASEALMGLWAAAWGNPNPFGVQFVAASPSYIFYRYHLVDLTVAGMDAMDMDDVTRRIFGRNFGPGGKFFGDTWDDPATLLG